MSMRKRCENPKSSHYAYYGGRGIKVCERWQKFENFLADMGEPPLGCSIDRVDNDGNYEPGNCRWATPQEQRINRRNTLYLTINGVRKPAMVWSRELGIPYKRIKSRKEYNIPDEMCVDAADLRRFNSQPKKPSRP